MQRVLSELVSREVKDPRVGPVTVTQVALAPDLSSARVFVVRSAAAMAIRRCSRAWLPRPGSCAVRWDDA